MTVPILLDGKECGTLELRRDGPFTLFEARCEHRPELTRLWVFGGGKRGYLGVMQPEGEGLALRRRLSRAAMRSFPEKIEYAGAAPGKPDRIKKSPRRSGKQRAGRCGRTAASGAPRERAAFSRCPVRCGARRAACASLRSGERHICYFAVEKRGQV